MICLSLIFTKIFLTKTGTDTWATELLSLLLEPYTGRKFTAQPAYPVEVRAWPIFNLKFSGPARHDPLQMTARPCPFHPWNAKIVNQSISDCL